MTDKEHEQRCHDYEMGVIEGNNKFKTIDFLIGLFLGICLGYLITLL